MSQRQPIIPPDKGTAQHASSSQELVLGISGLDTLLKDSNAHITIIKSNATELLDRCFNASIAAQDADINSLLYMHDESLYWQDHGDVVAPFSSLNQIDQMVGYTGWVAALYSSTHRLEQLEHIISLANNYNVPCCILCYTDDVSPSIVRDVVDISLTLVAHNGVHALVETHPRPTRRCVAIPALEATDYTHKKQSGDRVVEYGVAQPWPVVPTILSVHYPGKQRTI